MSFPVANLRAQTPAGDTFFEKRILPVLMERCYKCHSSKAEKLKGDLRLDTREAVLRGGEGGPVIVPGDPEKSRLIRAIGYNDENLKMPPKGKLAAEQIADFEAWVKMGAPDSRRAVDPANKPKPWPFSPLRKSTPPIVQAEQWVRSPIDRFILAKLEGRNLAPAPEADRRTLIRRLSYDLVGLPPAPSEIESFVKDRDPQAYEKLVERLLASPQYGERWARHWLDVVRYTESQGFEYDKLRPNAWHYRDYVIASFNRDKPYDQFIMEQIAGDAMEPATSERIIAASMLVCGAWDEAGNGQANATQRMTTREEELEDLISVVSQTFLGLTANCARCHSHKFDPIPQEDYYRIKAVFDGVKHGERPILPPTEMKAREEQIAKLNKRKASIQRELDEVEEMARHRVLATRTETVAKPQAPRPMLHWSFNSTGKDAAGSLNGELRSSAAIDKGKLQLDGKAAYFVSPPITKDLREKTLEAWVSLATLDQGGGAAISLESLNGSVFDAIVYGERQPRKWTAGSNGFVRTKDLDSPEETAKSSQFIHVAAVYRSDNTIALYRNGKPIAAPYMPADLLPTYKAGTAHVLLGMRHTGGGKPFLAGEIESANLYDHALSDEEVAASYASSGQFVSETELLAALSPEQRRNRDEKQSAVKAIERELAAVPSVAVSYAGVRFQPPPTHRLLRGSVKSPAEQVSAGALSAITTPESDFHLAADSPEAERRLKLANWIADARNPLTARVMANRVWHYHFGQGIVGTPNDFGASGEKPSHPELLGWLAGEFIDHGWSVKELHRLIVSSATYRQSSKRNEFAAAIDADNRLVWHFAPRRLEAEAVRDSMLLVSGQINLAGGGPSFQLFEYEPFPANVYRPVDKIGREFNRRTIYAMNVNSGKNPLLDAFDCPDPSVKVPNRRATTTPLQALALMNNSFVERQAAHFADRITKEAHNDASTAVDLAYQYALGRHAQAEEAQLALSIVKQHGFRPLCWALFNSTEFLYVE